MVRHFFSWIASWQTLGAFAAASLGSVASGQLYLEDFDTNSTADWVVNPHPGGASHAVSFFFDYSTVGIPPAPNSAGGTTRGLKMQANLTTPGVFGGFSVSPAAGTLPDLAAAGDFVMTLDVWSNFNGPFPGGGNGSTNLSCYGVLTSGTTANFAGTADGVWFAHTGDGGSSIADYRIYDPAHPTSRPDGDPAYVDSTRNDNGITYQVFGSESAPAAQQSAFPQQTGTTLAGAAGMAWRQIEIVRAGDAISWRMDGVLLGVVDVSGMALGGGNILFGHSDINQAVSSDPNAANLLFTLIDNVRITAGAPTGACCFPDGSCSMVSEGECEWAAGAYAGDGVDCAGANCPVTVGACCFSNGDCFDADNQAQCAAQRGVYQGPGSSCASGCADLVNGPDVAAAEINDIFNWGGVGGVQAYSLGVFTCNIGDEDLHWGNTWNGSPVMATNAYRLLNGRLEQVGMSWAKHSCCVTITRDGCGLCTGVNGQLLGIGCRDSYSAEYNGREDRMGPRSAINAWTGAIPTWPMDTGDAVFKRLQVTEADLSQGAGGAGAQYFVETVYVASDEAVTGNWQNNATYRPVSVDESNYALTVAGMTAEHVPAILAWRDYGGGGVPDPDVTIVIADVPGEGRFYAGAKVSDNGDGTWHYEYAVFNQNSDRAGGSVSVPVPDGLAVSAIGFHDVDYHSGEVYDNTDWAGGRLSEVVRWQSPQTFAQNANSNALRWGTMYNFRFDAAGPPADGMMTLGLFKPGEPASIGIGLPVPSAPTCPCELDGAVGINVFDLLSYLDLWFSMDAAAEFDGTAGINVFDLLAYLDCWFDASSGGVGPCA